MSNKNKTLLNNKKSKHTFAFYFKGLSDGIRHLSSGVPFSVADEHVLARMRIVRMEVGDTCILFDRESNVHFELRVQKGKKRVEGVLSLKETNKKLSPSVTFCLPLLKREHFDLALYSMVELGATRVQTVITEKVHRSWGQKDNERALNIMIAAAEQSKNFAFPELLQPRALEDICKDFYQVDVQKLFFDVSGQPAAEVFEKLLRKKPKEIILLVGPEGDLSESEKQLVSDNGFEFCALTPTILRAFQAAGVSLGMVRSFIFSK